MREDGRDGGARERFNLLPFSMEDIAAAISSGGCPVRWWFQAVVYWIGEAAGEVR